MKFIVLLSGEGEGCDYSIGCNTTWRTLKAQNWIDAGKEVSVIVADYYEPNIEKAEILEVVESELFDVSKCLAEREFKSQQEKEQKALADRKSAYEKLKAEFGE